MMTEEEIKDYYEHLRAFVISKYKLDYNDAENIVADAYIYYKERDKEDEFYKWGFHKCSQLAQNFIRDSKPMSLPLYFEEDDGELKDAFYITPTENDTKFIDLLATMEDILTPQEIEIVKYLDSGYSQTEIGAIFGVSKQAINKKVEKIRNKLTDT